MTAIIRWVRARLLPTRIYISSEPYGPVMPWQEALRRSTADVPHPRQP